MIFLREVDDYLLSIAVNAYKPCTGMWQQREYIGGHWSSNDERVIEYACGGESRTKVREVLER